MILGIVASQGLLIQRKIADGAKKVALTVSSLVIPYRKTEEGVLIRSHSLVWQEIVDLLGNDWSAAYKLSPQQWEELLAGAFHKARYDEVTLTPRSGDHGRDVIAIKRGIGCVKIIGSMKAYAPGHIVSYDAVRSLIGVMSGEQDVSKGIIATTSDFPPRIMDDPFISPFIPTRLELLNGEQLRSWLTHLSKSSD